MADKAVETPGSASEAYEKGVSTPIPKGARASSPSKSRYCAPVTKGTLLLVGGALLAIVAIVYGTALPSVITSTINDGVVTCSDADVMKEAFTDRYGDCSDCTPYYYSLSMFNVTNAMDYLENGAKLKVKEVGPYTYRRREIRVDVALSSDQSQVSYKMYTYHTFDQELSCSTCVETDQVISWDVGYLNVVSQAGGEAGFVTSLLKGTLWGGSKTDTEINEIVAANGSQIMRWVNGLNSNEPSAWKVIGPTVLQFLSVSVDVLAGLDLSGFEYNGLFVRRPMSQWALGYPSLLAGLALGSNYQSVCVTGGLEAQCASCKGDECVKLWAECKKCATGKSVVQVNDITCAQIEQTYAAAYGAAEAATFVTQTCKGFCSTVGLCAAPLPGAAEESGLDYSMTPPPSDSLLTYTQLTGCSDKTKIGEYLEYNGFKSSPLWAKLDARRNPTLAEINAFQVYGNCDAKTANMTCAPVYGQDGTGLKPGGASITGFPDKVDTTDVQMYLIQAKQNLTLVNTGEVVDDVGGIKMTRFIPPDDVLTLASWNDNKGTGYPVDGVQSLAFNTGFLAYVSYPVFMYGNSTLTDAVEITMFDGQIASDKVLYENGKLKEPYYGKYHTVVDVEPGTGKTMRALKRLQASYAVAYSQFTRGAPMTDLVWPNLKPEVISPAYIGEESATVKAKDVDSFKTIKRVLGSLLPVLIVGILLGVALAGYGFIYRRKAVAAHKSALEEAV